MKALTKFLAIAMTLLILVVLIGFITRRDAIDFALLKPQEKFARAWKNDVNLMQTSGALPAAWSDIERIEIKSEPSPARDWLEKTTPPIATTKHGKYKLQLFAIHWIDENRYGVTLEYWLNETATGNTVWETARTLKLGFVY